MKTFQVLGAFNTPLRRFTAGQAVDESMIDGPLTVEDYVTLGLLKDEAPQAKASTNKASKAN